MHGAKLRQRHKRVIDTEAPISWIWDHGVDIEHEGKRYWLCKHCHEAKQYRDQLYSGYGTQYAAKHLGKHHKIYRDGVAPTYRDSSSASTTSAFDLVTPFNDVQYKRDYLDWIVHLDITFRQACHDRTIDLMSKTRPSIRKVLPGSASTVTSWILDAYERRQAEIKAVLHKSKSRINISSDLWTASNGQNYVGVIGHFIDGQGYLQAVLLGLPRLRGPHSGENLASCITKIIR